MDDEIQEIQSRLARLEAAVFASTEKRVSPRQRDSFAGPSGGVRLLIEQGLFGTKRRLGEVREALARNDYHYGAAQVQTALNRLSARSGPLAASKEAGKKVYVRRK